MKNRLNGKRIMNRIAGKLTGLLGALLVLCLLGSIATPVLALPTMPHRFYGSVTINSAQAPTGTIITARITGAPDATTTVNASGNYSFQVPADDPDTPVKEGGVAGDTIQFLVGTTAAQTSTFAYGGITNLDLTITTPPVPAPTVVGAATNAAGTVITITFSKNMANPVGKHGQFKYQIGGGADQNFSAAALNADNTKVDLTCAGTAIAYGNTVTVSYTKGTVLAADGGVLESFTNQVVTNNMPAPSPPGDQKLIGRDDDSSAANEDPNYIIHNKWTAAASGTMTRFFIRCKVAGNVKCAIYSDDAGSPKDLLNSVGSTAISPGWVAVDFPATTIVSGTVYWLTINCDTKGTVGYKTGTGLIKYKAFTFANAFPNPAGTGYTQYGTAYANVVAGWGSAVAPVPPVAPIRDCTRLTFRWNTSTGATTYRLQVSTNANFTGTDVFNEVVGDVTSHEVTTGLTAGTTYYWRVKAGNSAGWSGWSTPTGSMRCGGVL